MDLDHWLKVAADAVADWQRTFSPYEAHPSTQVSDERMAAGLAGLGNRKALAEWQRLGIRALDGRDLVTREREASLILPDGPGGAALLAFDNFRATLRWNNSSYFAAAVGYLADGVE